MLIELNKEIIESLSKTEFGVIQFINQNEEAISKMSILDIACETYSSPATVSRAIRKCHLQGFNELRYRTSKKEDKSICTSVNNLMYQSLTEIRNIIESVSAAQIVQAIEQIRQAKNVFVLGRGLSEYVAEEFSLKLQLLNVNSIFIKDPNIMRIKSQQTDEGSLLVIFSLNGMTPELIESARNARCRDAKILCICCNPQSELLSYADVSLVGYSEPYSSITEYEVRSRLPLSVLSRMITECFSQT